MTLKEALLALGDDVDAVVRTLQDKGIRGVRLNSCTCPIANYLTSCGFSSAEVGSNVAHAGDESEELPAAVAAFLRRFDATAFPELESK